ncbi:MAG: hypothetical protein JRI36_05865 [Deltaproteobacteria bacterium]|nr:hypothetical protein [Deltaproteobacteria bacterium]
MKKKAARFTTAFFIGVLLVASGLGLAVVPPVPGGSLPNIVLPIPSKRAHRQYLGLNGTGTFKIPQIKAKVVIVEVFNMY